MSSNSSQHGSDNRDDSDRRGRRKDYITSIDLDTAEANQVSYTTERSTTSNFQGKQEWPHEDLEIVASTMHFRGDDESFHITTKQKSQESSANNATVPERWV